jgi:hypothetical protein
MLQNLPPKFSPATVQNTLIVKTKIHDWRNKDDNGMVMIKTKKKQINISDH